MHRTLLTLLLILSFQNLAKAASILVLETPAIFNPDNTPTKSLGRLTFVKGVEYASEAEKFGGFSALLIEGDQLISVSDQGHLLQAKINHQTLALQKATLIPLRSNKNKTLKKKKKADAESLARDGKGGFYVSFERKHRISHYPNLSGPSFSLTQPEGFKDLPSNHGTEASVRLKDGRLVILAESSATDDSLTSGWFLQDKIWHPFSYRRYDEFKPTGAALLPSGNILILERHYTLFDGVSTRLREVPFDQIEQGNVVEGILLGEFSVDNFEGVDVRVNEQGETLVYLISDDNFSALQKNLLFVFKLED